MVTCLVKFVSVTSGKFDLYGNILNNNDGVLGDLKVTSSYKLMKALGIYKKRVPTGEVYKTGSRKGQPKYRNELRYDGAHHVLDWAIQLNYYRLLLEQEGFPVQEMYIQAMYEGKETATHLLLKGALERS